MNVFLRLAAIGLLTACQTPAASVPSSQPLGEQVVKPVVAEGMAVATFAGGCFWCMEAPFDQIEGVVSTTSGYTDGQTKNPTYKEVSSGRTGHTEAIQVVYDPNKVSYAQLVEQFWHNIDPTQADGQFCDIGTQYRTGIFVHDAEQRTVAEASKAKLVASFKGGKIVTPIKNATRFYPAEAGHQDFYLRRPGHYQRYRTGCGRDARLKELWGESAAH